MPGHGVEVVEDGGVPGPDRGQVVGQPGGGPRAGAGRDAEAFLLRPQHGHRVPGGGQLCGVRRQRPGRRAQAAGHVPEETGDGGQLGVARVGGGAGPRTRERCPVGAHLVRELPESRGEVPPSVGEDLDRPRVLGGERQVVLHRSAHLWSRTTTLARRARSSLGRLQQAGSGPQAAHQQGQVYSHQLGGVPGEVGEGGRREREVPVDQLRPRRAGRGGDQRAQSPAAGPGARPRRRPPCCRTEPSPEPPLPSPTRPRLAAA